MNIINKLIKKYIDWWNEPSEYDKFRNTKCNVCGKFAREHPYTLGIEGFKFERCEEITIFDLRFTIEELMGIFKGNEEFMMTGKVDLDGNWRLTEVYEVEK